MPRSPRAPSPCRAPAGTGATVLVSPAIERAPIVDTAAMDGAVAGLAAARSRGSW
ncbi:hypothetical protein NKG05_14775 [Oerskovia sp. M15]